MKHSITTTAALLITAITFCLPLTALSADLPVCTYALSDSDGDGFGWEDRSSCRVTEDSQKGGSEQLFGCTDDDGDGWGWNGVEICRVESENCEDTYPVGDGWGWNGEESCEITAYPARFSEIEMLRQNYRQIDSKSVGVTTLACTWQGRTQAFDLRTDGTTNQPFANDFVWGHWSTGLSDSDGIIWIHHIQSNFARYRTVIKLQPSITVSNGSGEPGNCFWID